MIKYIIVFLSFVSFLYVGIYCNIDEYRYLYSLPLSYIFIFYFVYSRKLIIKNSPFYIIILILSFLRYVVLPVLIVSSNYYWGRASIPPRAESFDLSFYLMIYEFLIMSLFIDYYEGKYLKNEKKAFSLSLKTGINNNIVLFSFVFLLLIYFIYDKSWLLGINFFLVTSIQNVIDQKVFLTSYLLLLVKNIIYVYIIYYFSQKYNQTNNKIYLISAFFITVLSLGVFIGVNRADILMPTLASIYLLYKLFPSKSVLKFSILLLIGGGIMLSAVTNSRNFYRPSSMTELQVKTDEFQAYLGGPYNVALATEIERYFPEASKIQVFIFDVFRPMFGVNLLIKDFDIKYSGQYFNERIFFSDHMSQIIPMIGQGYLFFGVLFAPIINVCFIIIAYKLINYAQNTTNAFIYYFFMISFVRTSFMMGHNAMILMSDLSFNLFVFLLLYFLNKKISI